MSRWPFRVQIHLERLRPRQPRHHQQASRDLTQSQRARDQAFRTLKAGATEYTFEYVVIQVPPGSLPGIEVPVPVSHIRFKGTIFFAFNKADIEPVADKAILDLARTNSYFNNVGVRSFILNGAPFAYKTTNISVRVLFAGNDRLQDVFVANNPDGLVVDLDGIDD
jgi:hypothetical protein